MADITLVNLNMLYLRYGEQAERELHVPLGPLYLIRVLEDAGFEVDFRDYQFCGADDPFDMETFLQFVRDPAPVIGLSCMANLLPFTMLALKALRERYADRTLVLGGVGSKSVEEKLLERFPWLDVICRGEAERTGPELLSALGNGGDLSAVKGLSFRRNGSICHTPARERITDIDTIRFPAFEKVDLGCYAGYGMMTSRGCPYPCTFCSVAPVWNLESYSRSPRNIVDEMALLKEQAGVDLFLFQDEFFISGKPQVMAFCAELKRRKLDVCFKAFGRVNLVDTEMMQALADAGCVELRFGIESGSDRILSEIRKGFTSAEVLEVLPGAIELFPRVDAFYVWGFPFEMMEDFNQSLFQMVSLRMMGARILPSLLCLLPQTEIYRQWSTRVPLTFCPYLLPEFVFTGHEVCQGGTMEIPARHRAYFD
ncbi:MAG: B12-binding domain-containing radical SAM protein, partial [Planctomycetota bacterium]